MDKRGKQILLFSLVSAIAVALFAVLILNSIFAAEADATVNVSLQGQTPTVPLTIVEDALTTLNFSITEANITSDLANNNITEVNITLPIGVVFENYTGLAVSAIGANFSSLYNFTNKSSTLSSAVLSFRNQSAIYSLVLNGTNRSFWFNVTVATPGKYNITINASYGSVWNATNVTLNVSDITVPRVQQFNSTYSVQDNGTSLNASNVTLSCNMTDNGGLASVTLFIVNAATGATAYTNSTPEIGTKTYTQVLGTYNQTNFTQKIDVSGTYKWYCQATDLNGNSKYSDTNFTIIPFDITTPRVQQFNSTYSVNDNITSLNASNVTLSCNMTDDWGLASVSLFIVNAATGATAYTNSTPEIGTKTYTQVTGTYNQTNFTQKIYVPGNYTWYCQATDLNGNSKYSDRNYTILPYDNIPPIVDNTVQYIGNTNSRNTENFTTFNTTTAINVSCNMSDNFGLSSVTLFVVSDGYGPIYTNSTPDNFAFSGAITGTNNQTNFTQTVDVGYYSWYCLVRDTNTSNMKASETNATNASFVTNAFSFNGWVKNTTFNNVSGANVSIYEFIQGQNAPPTQRIIKSTTTAANGQFNLNNIMSNGSQGAGATIYKVSVYLNNSDGDVIEVGPTLPQLPSQPFRFSMIGGTFYLQNATTLSLYAYNNLTYQNFSVPTVPDPSAITPNVTSIKFGYEIMDQALGFPIASSIQSGVYNVNVSVPANRNYTVIFMRDPGIFTFGTLCEGPGYMNATNCPSPPLSVSVTSENVYSGTNSTGINSTRYLIIVNKSLAFTQVNLTGCLNIVGNTSDVNVTDIISKMVPWAGFVPPIKGEVSNFDASRSDSLKTDGAAITKGCTRGGLGMYNLTLMGAASGIEWMLEAYAGNTSQNESFVVYQNVTMTATEKVYNLTLVKALGSYIAGAGDVNASKIEIAVMDSNGTAPQNAHIELFVRSPVFGTMHYVIESLTNGKFNFTFPNNTQEAYVRVYTNQFAPKEQKVKLYSTDVAGINRTNVTISAFNPRMVLENGSLSSTKTSITMRFMKYSTACNVYTPDPVACKVGDDKSANFDPLGAMMAGKINLWMKTRTNITLYFINVDMLANGPPDAMMGDNASSATSSSTSAEQVWKFGSAAPKVYDKVMIGIPYNASIDENMSYVINISTLYDNDWNTAWNMTANTTAQLPAEYSDFNTTWFTTGMTCSNTSTASVTSGSCYMNVTNNRDELSNGTFWMTIPHFSNTANKITGAATAAATTPTTTSSTGGSSGGGAGTIYSLGALTAVVSKEIGIGETLSFTIENSSHTVKVLGITATSASVQIHSIVKTKLLQVGQPAQEVDVDDDGVNEISVALNSVNITTLKVTLTITPLVGVAPAAPPAENVTTPAATPEQQPAAAPAAGTGTPDVKKASSMWLWIGILSLVVVAIVVVILVQKLRKD